MRGRKANWDNWWQRTSDGDEFPSTINGPRDNLELRRVGISRSSQP
ncbi:hypothetical protein ANO14919_091100 [Xylariales sp. No.14919]|nr:hypothetical protein ANO14919_091100 [Xylariales sp. No.14919]